MRFEVYSALQLQTWRLFKDVRTELEFEIRQCYLLTQFCFTGNQMALGGAAMGVTTSEQTNLHSDSLPNSLNTNKSVPLNKH